VSIESAADRSSFLDVDEFGSLATIGAGTIYETTANGIFDNEFIEAVSVDSLTPTFQCRTADVANIQKGFNLTVNSTDYTIAREPQQDGTGLTLLILEKT